MIKLIVAYDNAGGIGYEGKMPWSIKEEMQLFKRLTMGHTIVFGRTTFEGIKKALPGRSTVVVSRNQTYECGDKAVQVIHDFRAYLEKHQCDDTDIYICGGSQIYAEALPYVKEASVSVVKGTHVCDATFPDLLWKNFDLVDQVEYEQFTHLTYRRRD